MAAPTRTRRPLVQVVRYALDSTVLPLVTETLPVAEAARRALMSIYGGLVPRMASGAIRPCCREKTHPASPCATMATPITCPPMRTATAVSTI